MNDEKRDYTKNGLGRRHYDIGPCPFFDWGDHKCREVESVRRELSTKLSTKIFTVFVASAGSFLIFFAGAVISMSYKSLDQIGDIKEQTAKISTRQETIIDRIERGEKKRGKESTLDRLGDDGGQPSESWYHSTGSSVRD